MSATKDHSHDKIEEGMRGGKVFIYNHPTRELVEKATLPAVTKENYRSEHQVKEYKQHLFSLIRYPCTWLTEADNGKEFVEGVDFLLQLQRKRSYSDEWINTTKYFYDMQSESDRRIITLPIPVNKDGGKGEEKDWLLNYCEGHLPGDFTVGEVVEILKIYCPPTPTEVPVEFAEWLAENEWEWLQDNEWFDKENQTPQTTSQLYTIFKNK